MGDSVEGEALTEQAYRPFLTFLAEKPFCIFS